MEKFTTSRLTTVNAHRDRIVFFMSLLSDVICLQSFEREHSGEQSDDTVDWPITATRPTHSDDTHQSAFVDARLQPQQHRSRFSGLVN